MNSLPIILESLCPSRELTQAQVSTMLNEVKSELDNLLAHLDAVITKPTVE